MAMILTRPLENKGAADSITCKPLHPELHTPEKMSQGPTLFSCGMMENGGWRDLDRKCPLQLEQASSIWDCLPEKSRDTAAACSVTSLIRDLSLSDHHGNPAAPPSKRQCRSLSFSDEMSSCRTAWRPLGSKVWTPVEKRRCYSGGSVQRYSSGPCAMQRSSSFSLPSRADTLSSSSSSFSDRAGVHGRFGGQPCPGILGSAAYAQAGDLWCSDSGPAGGRSVNIQRSLSCSRERFSFSEYCPPSASSTPASTPELARRSGGLSRSRSQPCVLNEKKVGVKRRRPEDPQELRPSLDLAKMTQNCQTFNSLSCLSTTVDDCGQQSPFATTTNNSKSWTALLSACTSTEGREPAGTPGPDPPPATEECTLSKEDLAFDESDCGIPSEESGRRQEDRASAWQSPGTDGASIFPLDGELDIEQIENN